MSAGRIKGGRSSRWRSSSAPEGRRGPPESAELITHDVSLAILGPLRDLDLVAFLRFASVCRAFNS